MSHPLYQRYGKGASANLDTSVLVETVMISGFWQYCTTAETLPQFAAGLGNLGLSVPAPVYAISAAGRHVLAVGPARYWVLQTGDGAQAGTDDALLPRDQIVNLQGSRLMVKLTGAGVAEALSCLAPHDFGPSSFAAGKLVDTLADGIPVTIWRGSDTGAFYAATPLSYASDFLSRI